MAYEVCEESLDAVCESALSLHNATRGHSNNTARFQWLYRGNPDGEAVLWTIRDTDSGEMVGFTAALPRRMLVDGEVRICWNGADFSMQQRYRTLGPAIKLRRAARNGIEAGRADFLYSHPNKRMAVIHSRVGHVAIGRMVRYAKVLRTAPYLQRWRALAPVAKPASQIADTVLHVAGRAGRHRLSSQVRSLCPTRFDARFDQLFERFSGLKGIRGIRDAQYLNWRYADNPLYQTHALIAEQGDQLRGYLLMTPKDGCGYIKDVYPPEDEAVVSDLLAAAIRQGYKLGLSRLSITMLESNPLLPAVRSFGFRERPDTTDMFAYVSQSRPWSTAVLQKEAWFLTVGDRDV